MGHAGIGVKAHKSWPTNPISPKRIKNATKIVKSIEVVLRARAKRWTADWY